MFSEELLEEEAVVVILRDVIEVVEGWLIMVLTVIVPIGREDDRIWEVLGQIAADLAQDILGHLVVLSALRLAVVLPRLKGNAMTNMISVYKDHLEFLVLT